MDKQTKKLLIDFACVAVLLVAIITLGFVVTYKQDKFLKQYPEYAKGIIIDKYVGAKRRPYAKYEFVAKDGKTYEGHQRYMQHKESIMIGDTCEVVYALVDPAISKLLRYDDGTLILHHPRLKDILQQRHMQDRLRNVHKNSPRLFD
jgi:hypothetical protein